MPAAAFCSQADRSLSVKSAQRSHRAAVRPGQVVVRGQVLPEPGSELLHTEHIHVLGITKVVIPVEPEGLGVRVQVQEGIAAVVDDCRHARQDGRVIHRAPVREADEEQILHAARLGVGAEVTQGLLVFGAHVEVFRLHVVRADGGRDLQPLCERAAGALHLQALQQRAAPQTRRAPVLMVLLQAEIVRHALAARHQLADGAELVGRQRDVVDPFVQADLRVLLVEIIQKGVDLHDDDLRLLAAQGLGEHGAVQACRRARHGQRIAGKAAGFPHARRAVAGVELARADEHDIERILRLQIKAADVALVGGVIHAQHIREYAIEQRGDQQKNDGAQGALFGFGTRLHSDCAFCAGDGTVRDRVSGRPQTPLRIH